MATFASLNLVKPSFGHFTDIQSWLLSFVMLWFIGWKVPKYLVEITDVGVAQLWQPEYYPIYGFLYCEFKLIRAEHRKWIAFSLFYRYFSAAIVTGA
jgi:hypothetical protein